MAAAVRAIESVAFVWAVLTFQLADPRDAQSHNRTFQPCFGSQLERLGLSWGHFGRLGGHLGRPGGLLSRLWALLGPSWEPLGPSWGNLGASRGALGPLLGRS